MDYNQLALEYRPLDTESVGVDKALAWIGRSVLDRAVFQSVVGDEHQDVAVVVAAVDIVEVPLEWVLGKRRRVL